MYEVLFNLQVKSSMFNASNKQNIFYLSQKSDFRD